LTKSKVPPILEAIQEILMALTPERKVKNQCVEILKKHGAYYFFPASNGLGRAGIPDIIVCLYGYFLAVECKAGKGKTTALQDRELQRIRNGGGVALVINEHNMDELENVLQGMHSYNTSDLLRNLFEKKI
jgi:Holliday junction resolvase